MTAMINDSYFAGPRLARADWSAPPALASLLEGPEAHRVWAAAALLLEALAGETLGDPGAGGRALRDHAADTDLTHGETRVLHYLPTNLSSREIADELYVSVNTIKTHQRHLYQKLGARSRSEAVTQACALGLLPPSACFRVRGDQSAA
jgi:LuxR family transcriptional regulator, maltose regulon positive regulatory protein